ncbi:phosphatidate cytidylyltransferase [Filibacter tadaridae]|uniref:Phosphatidate cytidylyltransferase n=1 Tax=Filibacter tadaridae TaxID=2483811 RepID=A0A3P5X652_9BACL|nr:phosphatidate cytidylyltransferase [Filibacter tadaridae]VDC29721.1 Phosphatidate cytidylyltransferase [Filibacter tadaridae]
MKQRIITAVVAAALFIPLVIVGGIPFIVAIYAIATVGLYELLRMRDMDFFSVEGIITWLALVVLLMPVKLGHFVFETIGYTKMEMVFIIVLILLIYTVIVKNRFTFDHAAFSILGVMYVGIGFYYLIETRMHGTYGIEYVVYALLVVWTTDSGAYFTGRKIGKRKLWPEISPNKTIEGFAGGILSAIVFASVFQYFIPIASSFPILIFVTVIASIVGQLGDLVESALKRNYDVKDSGKLLPGHGGILDRFDSLIFVLPLLHFLHFIS